MFRNLFFCLTAFILIAALYLTHVRQRPADLPFYRKLVQESIDLHAHSALEKAPVKQARQGVRKDIWTIKNGTRIHGSIESALSNMNLLQKKGKMEAVEILQGIEASLNMDEQIRHLKAESGTCYFPSCRIEARNLDADFEDGKCMSQETLLIKDKVEFLAPFRIEHPTGRLYGEKGTLRLNGATNQIQLEEGVLFEAARIPFSISSNKAKTILPAKSSFSKLTSEKIEFWDGVAIQTISEIRVAGDSAILSQNTLQMFPKEGSSCSIFHENDRIDAKEILFNRDSQEILFSFPHGRLEDKRTLFEANTGKAKFLDKKFQPQTLYLAGNVRIASHLQEKESFAIADSAIFHLNQKKVVLESSPDSRVLFRQEGVEISAPLVHIEQLSPVRREFLRFGNGGQIFSRKSDSLLDSNLKGQTFVDLPAQEAIQGFGDVRFFFYPEEQSVLETIFSKYL